ncbi:LON peptidase substrate-binding domain-containing protein [Rubinisphaera margarita]|uniref:LON peptidase substrate-binding domain-containing protein n=1 Tax=Rubinisphaera margarita TaxID=2909586 RepID=UPI001EE8321B|nr:LON peptidase substrate-binding domain-containing protein [Rubinisphaera margarita]MCG6154304.1 LON peptidase substrate-binding domain-containing protein [Rubinisphaera margarita]
MISELIPLPSDFDGSVRLFPLPDLVLFPRMILPLHIFEPRYCEMLHDALQTDQLITMATLQPKDGEAEAIAPTACIGLVVAQEETVQGTYKVVLAGIERAAIRHEIESPNRFRRAMVEVIHSDNPDSEETQRLFAERLLGCFTETASEVEQIRKLIDEQNLDLGTLTDLITYHSELQTQSKLNLLAEPETATRANQLLRLFGNANKYPFPPKFSEN